MYIRFQQNVGSGLNALKYEGCKNTQMYYNIGRSIKPFFAETRIFQEVKFKLKNNNCPLDKYMWHVKNCS